jgi:hypothetical protein
MKFLKLVILIYLLLQSNCCGIEAINAAVDTKPYKRAEKYDLILTLTLFGCLDADGAVGLPGNTMINKVNVKWGDALIDATPDFRYTSELADKAIPFKYYNVAKPTEFNGMMVNKLEPYRQFKYVVLKELEPYHPYAYGCFLETLLLKRSNFTFPKGAHRTKLIAFGDWGGRTYDKYNLMEGIITLDYLRTHLEGVDAILFAGDMQYDLDFTKFYALTPEEKVGAVTADNTREVKVLDREKGRIDQNPKIERLGELANEWCELITPITSRVPFMVNFYIIVRQLPVIMKPTHKQHGSNISYDFGCQDTMR